MMQANTKHLEGEDTRKYEVGARLRFVAYNPEEMCSCYGNLDLEEWPTPFKAGDVLIVSEKNGCGMGIDVVRESDKHPDMIWAEEVEMETP